MGMDVIQDGTMKAIEVIERMIDRNETNKEEIERAVLICIAFCCLNLSILPLFNYCGKLVLLFIVLG